MIAPKPFVVVLTPAQAANAALRAACEASGWTVVVSRPLPVSR